MLDVTAYGARLTSAASSQRASHNAGSETPSRIGAYAAVQPTRPLALTSYNGQSVAMGFRKKPAPSRLEEVLFDSSTIDIVALSSDRTQVELHIVVDSPWTGSDAQIRSLQEKIHTYVGFAAGGQLAATHPEAEGHPWTIVITSRVGEPDVRTADVLARTADPVANNGGSLVVRA